MQKNIHNKHYCTALLMTSILLGGTGCDSDGTPTSEPLVWEVNNIPAITSTADTTALTRNEYSYTITATDEDADDVLSYYSGELPSWLTFNESTGELSGTPATLDIGSYNIALSVTDGTNDTTQNFVLDVTEATSGGNWTMVWSDEFDGSTLNTEYWNIQTGDGSEYGLTAWGNNEEQWYKEENITVSDGNLVITAKEEPTNGYPYTSGRLRSDNKVDIKYGRIEARVKTPIGQGLWSAFWMLPTDSDYGGWASGGEIDIMEAVSPGENEDVTYGTLHYAMSWPLNQSAQGLGPRSPIDEYHVYAIEWEENEIRWFIDDLHYATISSDTWWSYYYANQQEGYVSAPKAPFNQDFHLIFNMAVGGYWPGSPNENTVFPAETLVDYVRVYKCDINLPSGAGCANNINPTVEPAAPDAVYTNTQTLYDDGISSLNWNIADEEISRELNAAVAWDNGGAIVLTELDIGGDNGLVLDINTTNMGNVAINATDGNTISLFGMGNSAQWWETKAGELKFSLYIDSANTTENSTITIKMDSGWPALGYKNLSVADLPKDEWTTVSVKVNDLIATPGDQPLNTNAVMNLFVIEFSAAAHVQLDNISVVCGHPSDNGCGISPPAVEISTEEVVVFDEAVNTNIWTNGMGAWGTIANTNYYEGDTDNHVNWVIKDTGEEDHNNAVEVNFNADGGNGVFYFQSEQPVDMTAFKTGQLIFDVKVTDYGSNTSGLVFKIDCFDPCSSGEQPLGVVGDGVWQTITVDIATLTNLDVSNINSPLVIFPTWGDQQGVTFLLDNVRFEKSEVGDAPVEEAAEIGDIFIDTIADGWALWDCCGGATFAEVGDDAEHNIVAEFTFASTATVAGFEASTPVDASGLTNGRLEFDFKMTAEPNDSSALWSLKLESENAATAVEVTLESGNEDKPLELNTWAHYTFDLDTLSSRGLDLAKLKLIMVFPTWGKADGAIYRIDNVKIISDD